MTPIVYVVGRSGSGKTAVIEALIRELAARGLKAAVLKHTHHLVELDQEGKDTWRMRAAGAPLVGLITPERFFLMGKTGGEWDMGRILDLLDKGMDLILVEGYHEGWGPKIEVLGKGKSPQTPLEDLLAVVGDSPKGYDVPGFYPEETAALLDLIEERLLLPGKGKNGKEDLP